MQSESESGRCCRVQWRELLLSLSSSSPVLMLLVLRSDCSSEHLFGTLTSPAYQL